MVLGKFSHFVQILSSGMASSRVRRRQYIRPRRHTRIPPKHGNRASVRSCAHHRPSLQTHRNSNGRFRKSTAQNSCERKPRDERPRPRPGRFQEDESAGERHSAAPYGAVDSGVEMQGSGCQDMAVRVQDLCEFSRLNCPPAISSHDSASFPPQPQVENHLSEAQASFVGLDCWGIPLFPSHVAYDLGRIRGHEPRACYD